MQRRAGKRMSRYEQEQILLLIDEIYRQYGRGWEREEYLANCLFVRETISYFENGTKKRYGNIHYIVVR